MLYDPKWNEETQTIKNLRELSRMLRNQQEWEDKWDWKYQELYINCGTAGCAEGLWLAQKNNVVTTPWPLEDFKKDFPELHEDDRGAMFNLGAYHPVSDYDVTPGMVADKIDAYILEHATEKVDSTT